MIRKMRDIVRGLKQKWGTERAKRSLWNREYAGGRWNHCEHTPEAVIYEYVYRYCRNGAVLDLGCGSGNTGNELDVDQYGTYTGVDISEVAVQKAAARSAANGRAEKNQYLPGDILSFSPAGRYDVILFRESIYYLPVMKIGPALERYAQHLTEHGVFVVHVSGTKRGRSQKILALIEEHFQILEKASPNGAGIFIAAFRPRK
jgi:SAM-dependent methyltransferase